MSLCVVTASSHDLCEPLTHTVQLIMEHLNKQPAKVGEIDFARVTPWYLNGWYVASACVVSDRVLDRTSCFRAKYFRQTVLFSRIMTPEISALMSKLCSNYAGEVRLVPSYTGALSRIVGGYPQVCACRRLCAWETLNPQICL